MNNAILSYEDYSDIYGRCVSNKMGKISVSARFGIELCDGFLHPNCFLQAERSETGTATCGRARTETPSAFLCWNKKPKALCGFKSEV